MRRKQLIKILTLDMPEWYGYLLCLLFINLDFFMYVFGFVDFIKMFVIGLCLTMIVNFALS